ncbi:hypothetical protein BGZ63DRAFT_38533 [Mariannaea sp. PMI_226]|nr:hypothetical protein BGZ63DRAFT_38533 [Mariannaea sp. PMI_226]
MKPSVLLGLHSSSAGTRDSRVILSPPFTPSASSHSTKKDEAKARKFADKLSIFYITKTHHTQQDTLLDPITRPLDAYDALGRM